MSYKVPGEIGSRSKVEVTQKKKARGVFIPGALGVCYRPYPGASELPPRVDCIFVGGIDQSDDFS